MFDANFDPYFVLGVRHDATIDQIKTQYRHKAMECHPDKGGTQEQMIEVIRAWEILSDPASRELCDRARAEANHPHVQQQWQQARSAASARASAAVYKYGQSWEEFKTWLDSASAEVQSTGRGRAAAGAMAGMLVGALLGLAAGALTGVGLEMGGLVGLVAGTIGGWLAMSRRTPRTAEAAQ